MLKLQTIDSIRLLFNKKGFILLTKEYTNSKQKLEYVCPNGHTHSIRLDHFRNGVGCPYCKNTFKKSIDFIKPFFEKEGYILQSNLYFNAFTKLKCVCPKGHRFTCSWHSWQRGNRCPVCAGKRRYSVNEIRDVFKQYGYKLLTDSYTNSNDVLHLKCPNGHDYYVTFSNFISKGSRCTLCSGFGSSSGELSLCKFLDHNEIAYIKHDRKLIPPYQIDIVIPSLKVAIEYCGLYWHSEEVGRHKNYHLNKLELCEANKYRLITIFEDEWLYNREVVLHKLSLLLGVTDCIIHASQCYIKNISTNLAKCFCDINHLQGYNKSSVKAGVFKKNELLAVMLFSKYGHKWKISRFCTKIGVNLVGSAHCLLQYFKRHYKWDVIMFCADRRWLEKELCFEFNFDFFDKLPPVCWYIKSKKRVKLKTGFRIWDCGNIIYKKLNNNEVNNGY